MKKIFFLLSLILVVFSCSLDESSIDTALPKSSSIIDENEIINEVVQLRSDLFGYTTKSLSEISITPILSPTKSATAVTYVVNYLDNGGYAVMATNGEEIKTVAITSNGYLDPQILQEALNSPTSVPVDSNVYGEEMLLDAPEDAVYGDEHLEPYPMDVLPYTEELEVSSAPITSDHPSIDFIVSTLVGLDYQYGKEESDINYPPGVWSQTDGVASLISTKWGQNGVYKQCCPTMPNGAPALVGCGAVAAGQLTAYLMPIFLPFNFPTLLSIGNKDDRYAENASEEEKYLVASYLRYVADSIYTTYGSGVSTSSLYNIKDFFIDNVLLDSVVSHSYTNSTDNSFVERIKGRLRYHLPVFMYGNNNNTIGHFFIIDGFITQIKPIDGIPLPTARRRDLFHINWGWNSRGDGYYLITNLSGNSKQGIDSSVDIDENTSHSYNTTKIIITYATPSWRIF